MGERVEINATGVKYDVGKAPVARGVLQYFPHALAEVAKVSAAGARKYAWDGWRTVPDGFARYSDALGRHLLAECDGALDVDTGCLHAAQVAWNALARLELMLLQKEKDSVTSARKRSARGPAAART